MACRLSLRSALLAGTSPRRACFSCNSASFSIVSSVTTTSSSASSSSSSSSRNSRRRAPGRGVPGVAVRASASSGVASSDASPAAATAPKDEGSVAGKTVIVTGANTGMGLVISQELALAGADVIMACRSERRGLEALKRVEGALEEQKRTKGDAAQGSASLELLDLASLDSVRDFASAVQSKHSHVHRLICNAGIMIPPHSYTKDGFESQFQVNHLSHYLLTRLLLPTLLSSPTRPSIVHVSSLAGENAGIRPGEFWQVARRRPEEYNAMLAYCQSKLAQVIFTVETSRRYGDQLTVNAVHPGIVNTDLFNRNVNGLVKSLMDSLGKLMESAGVVYSSEKGASTAIYLATNPASVTSTGGYWADCAPRPANPNAFNRDVGIEWWEQSAKAAGLEE